MPDATRTVPHISKTPSIGIFDSGLGGLSVLRELRRRLPTVPMHYVADSAHAPYGERCDDEIRRRSLLMAAALIDSGARMLVVACNTATAAAVTSLRERWPQVGIVGVEPGIKPGLQVSRSGRIGVMATEATLRSDRFRALLEREHAAAERLLRRTIEVHLQPCPGLAAAIETTELHGTQMQVIVERCCAALRRARVDTVVLGCTHYPFVAPLIQRSLGADITLVDTADAVARQAALRWAADVAVPDPADAKAKVHYSSSGNPQALRRAVVEWLGETDPDVGVLIAGDAGAFEAMRG